MSALRRHRDIVTNACELLRICPPERCISSFQIFLKLIWQVRCSLFLSVLLVWVLQVTSISSLFLSQFCVLFEVKVRLSLLDSLLFGAELFYLDHSLLVYLVLYRSKISLFCFLDCLLPFGVCLLQLEW